MIIQKSRYRESLPVIAKPKRKSLGHCRFGLPPFAIFFTTPGGKGRNALELQLELDLLDFHSRPSNRRPMEKDIMKNVPRCIRGDD